MRIGVPKIRGIPIPIGRGREHTGKPGLILTEVDSEMKSARAWLGSRQRIGELEVIGCRAGRRQTRERDGERAAGERIKIEN